MPDIVDAATRSRMMSRIRGRNTKPELAVRHYLHGRGLRFRLHGRDLPGRPDIVLARHHAVVFVNGCFWHQHQGCKLAYRPKSRPGYWNAKLDGNIERDTRQQHLLEAMGWRVFVIWECEIGEERLSQLVMELRVSSG